jgi:hypothetical protein
MEKLRSTATRSGQQGAADLALDLLADGGNDVGGRPQWRSELRPRAMVYLLMIMGHVAILIGENVASRDKSR